jgi:hypothetical protein
LATRCRSEPVSKRTLLAVVSASTLVCVKVTVEPAYQHPTRAHSDHTLRELLKCRS